MKEPNFRYIDIMLLLMRYNMKLDAICTQIDLFCLYSVRG
jgi:hypothetical protein